MTAESYERNIEQIILGLRDVFCMASTIAAEDLIADIDNRIRNEGKKPDGSDLKPYSESYRKFKQDPVGTNPTLARKLGLGSSRYQGFTNYELTGDLFNSIGITEANCEGSSFAITWGATDRENNEKLIKLSKRDKFNPMQPSEGEIANALANMRETIDDLIIQKILA